MRKIILLVILATSISVAQMGNHRLVGSSISCISASIPTTGLQLWYSADCYNSPGPQPTNGNTVSTAWHDRSGNANDAVVPVSGHPTYRTNQINGWPALDTFTNGIPGWNLTSGIASTTSITIFAVVQNHTTNAGGTGVNIMRTILSSNTDNANNLVMWSCFRAPNEQGMQAHTITFNSEDTTVGSGTASCDVNWHILNLNYVSPNVTFKLDRVTDTTINATAATISTPVNVFGSNNGSDKFNGSFAELIYYNTALSAGDRTTVENYLHTKYGL